RWRSAIASDVGCVRTVNEDACLARPEFGLWVVADGMGGHSAGDLASRMIIEILQKTAVPTGLSDFVDDVAERLQTVNRQLLAEALRRGQPVIGSTVVAFLAWGTQCACLWAGDSRAYRYRAGDFTRLTRDHTPVEDLIAQGKLLGVNTENYPASNILSRAVGAENELKLDIITNELAAGDVYLLCSDGLYREVSETEIMDTLRDTDAPNACDRLVQRALHYGGHDNVTVVVIEVLQ
ncbi:MAG: protein phosphatase 2C domain-containing protein, partial [Gammaproteobacteria bacterium]